MSNLKLRKVQSVLESHILVPLIESALSDWAFDVTKTLGQCEGENQLCWAFNHQTSSGIFDVGEASLFEHESGKIFFSFQVSFGFDFDETGVIAAYLARKNADLTMLPRFEKNIMNSAITNYCADSALLSPAIVESVIGDSFKLADSTQAELLALQNIGDISGFEFYPQDWFKMPASN